MTTTLPRHTLRILALTTFVSASMVATGFAEPPAKWKGNGALMEVFGSDSTGCIGSYVYVSRTGTTAAPQTWMWYDVYDRCASARIAFGYGLVANATFKVTNKSVTLVITPSNNANFTAEGVTGSIQLTLTADGVSSYRFSGHSRWEYLGQVYQSHGSWISRSASVSGNVLGFEAATMSGSFGEGRDRYIEIDRGSK